MALVEYYYIMKGTCSPKPVIFLLNALQNKDVIIFLNYSMETTLNFKEQLIVAWLQEEEKGIKDQNS